MKGSNIRQRKRLLDVEDNNDLEFDIVEEEPDVVTETGEKPLFQLNTEYKNYEFDSNLYGQTVILFCFFNSRPLLLIYIFISNVFMA